jgi:hypothetical protein
LAIAIPEQPTMPARKGAWRPGARVAAEAAADGSDMNVGSFLDAARVSA